MKKFISILLITVLVISNFPPQIFGGIFSAQSTSAASEIPFYDGKIHLKIRGLIEGENEFRRVDNKGLSGVQYLGDFRYATIYDGKLTGSPSSDNTTFTANGKSTRAYAGDKWYHIVPKSLGTARNLIRVGDLTQSEFVNRYGGSAENYSNLRTYKVEDTNLGVYGDFYYIGDVVKRAGGFAENTGSNFDSTNPTRLRILKTAKPDITNYSVSATNTDVGKPVTFDFTAYEYNYGGSNLNYEFIITDESGKEVGRKVKSVTSTKNSSGGNATQDRSHTGKYEEKNFFSFAPATAGKFTATLKVTDGVLRSSSTLTKTVTAKLKGQPYLEVTPETITIKNGEKANYKAFYIDQTEKRTEVTDKATWKAIEKEIAVSNGKGVFTGVKDGKTQVEAAYNGLKGNAELIVSATPAPEPPEEVEEEVPNEPPTVELIVPETVTVGDKFCAVANAQDSDGTIESYGWDYSGRGDIQGKRQACELYYEEEGEKTVTVVVTDDDGATAEDTKKIIVTKPMPTAYFHATGTHKENRKISLKAVHPYSDNNVALNKYPLVKETWTIQTADPSNQDKLRIVQDISGNVPYTQQIDFLLKETGEVNVTRYVENSIGESATYTTTLNVIKDEVPVAEFDVLGTVYRDPQDDNTAKATIEMKDNSYSTDDIIQKRIWRIAYDSNNDGNFTDESFVVIDEDNNESPKYTTTKVGKYLIELEVFEKYIHETIPEFVDLTFNKATTDLRNANTDKKAVETKIVEVDNLAPVTSIGLKDNKKTVEVQYDAVDSPYSEAQLNAMTPYLNNLLGEHDLKANITFSTNATYEHQVFASGMDKNYILTGDGKVYGMGGGIIGNGSATGVLDARGNIIAPYVEIPLPGKVRQVTATNRTATHFLLENGDVYGVGGNSMSMNARYDKNGKLTVFPNTQINVGTIGDGTTTPRYSPVKINLPAKVVKMESTPTTTLFLLETGEIYGVGNVHEPFSSNVYNSLIIFDKAGLKVPSDAPRNLKLPVKVKDFAMGSAKDGTFVIGYMIVIDENGVAYGMGDGRSWGTSDRYPIWEKLPQRLQDIKKATKLINQADMGYGGSTDYINLYLKKDGSIIRAMRTGLYSDDPITRFSLPKIKDITSSYRGYSHIFLSEDNDLYAVGHNQYGTLGFPIGSTFPWGKYDWITDVIESPSKVNLSFKVKQVSLGNDNMSILADNGNIYIVGRNLNANLGVNTKEDLTLFTRVGDFNIKFSKKAVFKQQPSPMYMTTFANKPLNVDDIQSKINNTNGYYVGITTEGNRGAVNTVVNNNSGKGTFLDIGTTYNDANLRAKIQELANYIIATENNNAVEVEVLLDESIGISPATIESKINSIVKAKVAGNSSVPFASRVRVLTGAYKFDEVSLDSKNKFVVAIKNNSYSAEQENQITATNLINNAHFLGVGTGINKGTIDRMVAKSLKKGTYLDNANIDSSLNAVADYILNEIEASRGMTEVFITTDESVDYTTNYSDYENDPLFNSYWKFKHELSYFESETGVMTDNNSKVQTPYKRFGFTGRYQVHYSAQDDPLTRYFEPSSIANFTDYRKWSNEANNLKIYVHKKPSAEFTFTLNQVTGAYTITNLAKDDDKASINVGFGAGLQSQRFDYRINGGEWIDGLPASPLEPNTRYEVRNTVIDLQNKSENVIKVLSRENLPPVALFKTDKTLYEENENVNFTNNSYDPNNDNLTAHWYYKLKEQDDNSYVHFATGYWKDNQPQDSWHTTIPNIQCANPNSNDICEYTVKLVVTDQYGLSDQTMKTIEVKSLKPKEITDAKVDALADFYWELNRNQSTSAIELNLYANPIIKSKHVALRNIKYALNVDGRTDLSTQKTIADGKVSSVNAILKEISNEDDIKSLKNKDISFSLEYEYTNHYRVRDGVTIPAWEDEFVKKVVLSDLLPNKENDLKLKLDYRFKEAIQVADLKETAVTDGFTVGRKSVIDLSSSAKVAKKEYKEYLKTDDAYKGSYELKSQTRLPIQLKSMQYEVQLPSNEQNLQLFKAFKQGFSKGTYTTLELDENLRSMYEKGDKYELPLQQTNVTKKAGQALEDKAIYNFDFVTDLFFMSTNTGFIHAKRYANEKYGFDASHTTWEQLLSMGKNEMGMLYKEITGVDFIDTMATTEFDDTQYYYLPVSLTSGYEPQNEYKNEYKLNELGLNEVTLSFDQKFSFENYLFGDIVDNPVFTEQQIKPVQVTDYPHQIDVTTEKLHELINYGKDKDVLIHEFRFADRSVVDGIKGFLN